MRPIDYYFSLQSGDERIMRIIHRHWFNIVIQFIPIFVVLGIMFLSIVLYPYIFIGFIDENARMFFYFLQTLFVLLMWIYGFVVWFDYYLDIWIMTTERIVNVEQKGLFSRQVSELKYRMIQDVSTDVKGFFPTVLNFGDITVQTAAEQSRFMFRSVGNPYEIKSQIMAQQKKKGGEGVSTIKFH